MKQGEEEEKEGKGNGVSQPSKRIYFTISLWKNSSVQSITELSATEQLIGALATQDLENVNTVLFHDTL